MQNAKPRCPGVPCATVGHRLDPESGEAAEQHVPGLEGLSAAEAEDPLDARALSGFFAATLGTTRFQLSWSSLRLFH